jgi:hypothetical protein
MVVVLLCAVRAKYEAYAARLSHVIRRLPLLQLLYESNMSSSTQKHHNQIALSVSRIEIVNFSWSSDFVALGKLLPVQCRLMPLASRHQILLPLRAVPLRAAPGFHKRPIYLLDDSASTLD